MFDKSIPLLILFATCIQAQTPVELTLTQVLEMLESQGPDLEILESQLDEFNASRRADLQWTSPAINYSSENVSGGGTNSDEQMVTLSKTFRFPGSVARNKKAWTFEASSADLNARDKRQTIIATAKSIYVRTVLYQGLVDYAQDLEKMLKDLETIVQIRQSEGSISLMEAQLLSASSLEMRSEAIEAIRNHNNARKNLHLILGIPRNKELDLTSVVGFLEVEINRDDLMNSLDDNPSLLSREEKLNALEQRALLERRSLIPEFSLEGGVKEVDDMNGIMLGLSVPLPLPGQSKVRHQVARARLNTERLETAQHRRTVQMRAETLFDEVNILSTVLKDLTAVNSGTGSLEVLIDSYQEGVLPISDLLNGVKLHYQNNLNYIEKLSDYYTAVFELEALTGKQLLDT